MCMYIYIYIYTYIHNIQRSAYRVSSGCCWRRRGPGLSSGLYSIIMWYTMLWSFYISYHAGVAWCSGGRRPLIAGCLSLQRLGMDLPRTCPAWDSNPRPLASESRPQPTELSVRLVFEMLDMRGERETRGAPPDK